MIITYTTNHQFNKQPGKVVDEFKLRVTYVPAGPPSPVPEEPEEGSSTLENGLHSLQTQDSVSGCELIEALNMSFTFPCPFYVMYTWSYLASISSIDFNKLSGIKI